ncbi:hypothetical protein XA68_10382 [Ophiocordyceps unilateralis]|uniref:Ima1 N-terminal domain-containing protein n=1 Tax=Ophiocordyceps unilateralis TaxID=268505 RepID=A0A2A9PHF2_OPHUN|nr:hypothetical protein XA68_10382 [Ophiocordyceps unilateralis]
MARFRAARHLNCFYCGRRSGIRNDGKTLEFVCRYCEATNYLDEKGEITDPPVATDGEATMTQFAAPKPPSQTDSIFCSACLKNQYLLTASLAQYLPDDPSDPDYAPLERNYHRYRRGLEKRYPQVCDQCAGRVEARLRQAGYTAKTDHLRRMMELGRGKRTASKNGLLDWVSCLGGVIWRAGFALQLLWHLVAVAPLLRDGGDGLRDPNEAGLSVTATAWLGSVADVLPGPDVLVRWTVAAAVASVWWNPYFVQLFRGFTRHLTGFKQWYSFQSLIVVFRLVCWGLVGVGAQSRQAQLSLHMAMASVMTLIYVFSRKSMRVDTSPLFGAGSSSGLKEAAMTPTRAPAAPNKHLTQPAACTEASLQQLPSRLSRNPRPSAAAAGPPSPNKGMGIDKSPFWYKVPAAPVTPARQLRNPPRAPDVKPAMLETDRFAFSPATTREKGRGQSTAGVEFRQPQFFAPERDDANSLADLLGQSFSLSQDRDQEGDDDDDDDDNNDDDDDGKVTTLGGQGKSRRTATSSARRLSHGGASTWHRRLVEPVALIVLPIMWALTLTSAVPFRNECQAAIIAMSGLMTFLGAGEERHGSRSEQVLAAWATAELAASFWVFYALSTDGEAPCRRRPS